jgi:putative resolvase
VSGPDQKEDLQRQVQQLEQWAVVARTGQKTMTLTDIGSGLGTERKNLQRVLALVQDYQVAEVVVTFSDRLTRFGLSYLQTLFSGYGVTLTVLHPEEEKTPEQELVDDLLAIIASFAGRLYGLRSRKQKALVDGAKQLLAEQEP